MAYTIDYGYTRSEETKSLTLALPNYTDFSPSRETWQDGTQINRELTNVTAPIDRPNIVRIFKNTVPNAYKDTKINIVNQAPNSNKVVIGGSNRGIISVTTDDSSCNCSNPVYLPWKVNISIETVQHPAMTSDVQMQLLQDTINKFAPEYGFTSDQLNAWDHGSLVLIENEEPEP